MYAFSLGARDPKILQLIKRNDSGLERSLLSIANGKIWQNGYNIRKKYLIKKMQFQCVTSLCKQSTGKNSIKSSSVSNHVLITPNINKKLKYLSLVGNELRIKSIQHTIVVDGMII